MLFRRLKTGLRRAVALRAMAAAFRPLPCPGCGGWSRDAILRRGRDLLAIDVAMCRDCGLVHAASGLPGAAATDFHRDVYPWLMGWNRQPTLPHLAESRLRAAARVRRIVEVVPDARGVVEIGCGLGHFLDECRGVGWGPLLGIEPGSGRFYARDRLGLPVADVGAEAAADPPFTPDLVALFHVIEHLDDPVAALGRVRRWMRPDGVLAVEAPDLLGEWSSIGLLAFHMAHRSYFTAETLQAVLARAGFAAFFVTRDDADGIHPGNLRIFARPCETPPPLPPPPARAEVLAHIRPRLAVWSLRCGYPRAAARLLKSMLASCAAS